MRTREPVDIFLNTPNMDDEELLCESELLTEEDTREKSSTTYEPDCSKRNKVCKNCICGRAEAENTSRSTDESMRVSSLSTGGCGNCSKGDAFRCSQCPYLGKPSWKQDHATGKITLQDLSDI